MPGSEPIEEWEIALALTDVYDRVRADPFWDHLRLPGIRLVEGFGPYRPRVLILGEAPGATENNRLRPFCGASGVALTGLMESAGLRAEDAPPDGPGQQSPALANAFLTNVVKYRPPGNRTPKAAEIEHGRIALRQEWAVLGRPKVIVAAGSVARKALTDALTETIPAGEHRSIAGIEVWAMYHPAFPLRQRRLRPTVERHWAKFGEWLRENGHAE